MATPREYLVGSAAGKSSYASTLTEAKAIGAKIAKREAWKGKWNLFYIGIRISKRSGPVSFKPTGWVMFVPVRGSGASADRILAELKRREGAAPFKWVRR